MTTMQEKARRGAIVASAVLAATLGTLGARAAHAVSISVVSPPALQDPSGSARVCVVLDTGGQQVAGVQNDLQWDTSCLSQPTCQKSGSHGKDFNKNIKPNSMKALLLSLQDTNPMPSGDLYCCTFQASLSSPGSCCSISMSGAASSDPAGKALSTVGRGGQVCLSSGAAGSGLQGRAGAPQPGVVGTDLGTGAPAPGVGAPAGGGAPVVGGAPAPGAPSAGAVVGGIPGQPPPPPEVAQAPEQPAGETAPRAGAPGAPAVPGAPQAQAPGAAGAPPAQAPAVGATPAMPAAPREMPVPPAEAPTAARLVAPTPRPTIAVKPAAPAPVAEPKSGSGCNCEIGASDAGGGLGLASLLVVAAMLVARRRKL